MIKQSIYQITVVLKTTLKRFQGSLIQAENIENGDVKQKDVVPSQNPYYFC